MDEATRKYNRRYYLADRARFLLTAAGARCSDAANCCAMSARQNNFDAGNRATV